MVDYIAAVLGGGVIVGMVLLLVGMIFLIALRLTGRRISRSTMRRMARIEILFGIIALAYVVIAIGYGGGIIWIVGAIQGPLLIYAGWTTLRDISALDKSDAAVV
jgi:hypothetical protein